MKKNNKKVLIVFAIFFVLVLFQHHFMWLYHDDYGYASLSYIGDVYKSSYAGYHTNLIDIIRFCSFHYNNWGGRVLYFFIECIMLRFGMHVFRIVQSIVITGIFYYIYKIVSSIIKKDDYRLAILCVSLYGMFEILLFRDGIFWITASVLYIFPLLPFFMYVYHYVVKQKKMNRIIDIILSSTLLLFATFSQEQISAMVVAFVFMILVYKYIEAKKKINWAYVVNFVFALIGFGILMLSPGSRLRMGTTPEFYNMSLFEKLDVNIPSVIIHNFGIYTRVFTLVFFAIGLYLTYINVKNSKNKNTKVLNSIALISNGLILFFSIIKPESYFSWVYNYKTMTWFKTIALWLIVIQLALFAYSVILYFVKEKNYLLPILFISSLGTHAVMLMAPYYSLRCSMVMQFVDFIIILYVLSKVFMGKNKYILIIPFVIICLFNYVEITYGYYRNNAINQYNHDVLIDARDRIKNGEKIDRVVLIKMKDIAYANNEPYEINREYIKNYMRIYYQLPEDFIIDYKDYEQ